MTNIKNNDVVFLLGAGISIPIGIPAMAGIYRAFMDKKNSGITEEDKKICQFLVSNMGVNPDLEEFLLAANRIEEFGQSGLNKFVEYSISKKGRPKKVLDYNRNLKVNVKAVSEVKNKILDFLSRMCFQFDRSAAERVNTGFVKTVSKLGYPVYSTNYDYSLEHVALEHEITIHDNFYRQGQRVFWNDKINFEGENGLRLIKLHGSVTWYEDHSGTIEKIYSPTTISPAGQPIGNIVIFPTRFKDIYSHNFFALYSHFLKTLSECKVLVIAGHSLRDDYLRAAIIERNRQGEFQMIVIDPIYPTEIKSILPPARKGTLGDIIHLPYKWEEVADEVSSILRDNPPESALRKCVSFVKSQKYVKDKLKIKGRVSKLSTNTSLDITIDLKAYLNQEYKPAALRVWLEAKYSDDRGIPVHRTSPGFIDNGSIIFGNDLTGVVDASVVVPIKIPHIPNWFRSGCQVFLRAALLPAQVKKLANVKESNTLVLDERKVNYGN